MQRIRGTRLSAGIAAAALIAGLVASLGVVGVGSAVGDGNGARAGDGRGAERAPATVETRTPTSGTATRTHAAAASDARRSANAAATLPLGGRRVLPHHILVAYYGTAGTGSLGVLGEDTPDRIMPRLRRAAAPFATKRITAQPVYELIVTVADPSPGTDGDYSHDIARSHVEDYIAAAHRNKTLLVLDLQPGRTDFLTVAKRWRWALEDPWVGLALDPEWRMAPGEVPAQTIGQVDAAEINRVSGWLARLTRRERLPQKALVLHQFRTDMISHIGRVRSHRELALVQHVDGFGTPSQKLSTYHSVARPDRFAMGFKLFYDEDTALISAERVHAIRPRVRYVSYQ